MGSDSKQPGAGQDHRLGPPAHRRPSVSLCMAKQRPGLESREKPGLASRRAFAAAGSCTELSPRSTTPAVEAMEHLYGSGRARSQPCTLAESWEVNIGLLDTGSAGPGACQADADPSRPGRLGDSHSLTAHALPRRAVCASASSKPPAARGPPRPTGRRRIGSLRSRQPP